MAVDPASDATFSRPGSSPTRRYAPVPGYPQVPGYGGVAGLAGMPPGMLAASADRERALDVLKAGFAEGRLTKAEHDDRSARVHATRTYGQLMELVADLPAGPFGGPAMYQGPMYPPRRAARSAHSPLALTAGWIGLIAIVSSALITALIIAAAASGQHVHAVISHPNPAAPAVPAGPFQGG